MADLKFDHAGSPLPEPFPPIAAESDVEPKGSAGLVNQAAKSTVPEVAPVYGAAVEVARDAALAKREADWSQLMSADSR